jgi:N-acetylmuramoyl-L-alanine amidase
MLDAGHGGRQGGAVRNKVDEKTITLSVALKLADELRAQGATVIMTRTTDLEVTLEDRVDLSNRVKPDIFLSIHVNANTDPFIHGVETYYYTNDGAVLADDLLQSLSSDLGEQSNWYRWEELYVLHYNSQVAALAEIGYLSNAPSFKNLVRDDYQKKVADALDTGILNYFKAVPKAPAPAIVPPPDTRPKPLSKDEMF